MAKRRYFKRSHAKGKMKIPLLVAIPVIAQVLIAANEQKTRFATDPMLAVTETLYSVGVRFTGYNARNGVFYPNYPINTWTGIILGYIGHKIMNKIGVNRMLSKLPYVSM